MSNDPGFQFAKSPIRAALVRPTTAPVASSVSTDIGSAKAHKAVKELRGNGAAVHVHYQGRVKRGRIAL